MAVSELLKYKCIIPKQSETIEVCSFIATVEDIQKFSKIERIARDENGCLKGFQRPQIANHIRGIRDYLEKDDSILPNPIIIAFTSGINIRPVEPGVGVIKIDISQGPLGYIVDGQQRFMALNGLSQRKLEVFISCFLCRDINELQRQFILVNNTRPLPKSLIYELLPQINGLPLSMSPRAKAARLTEQLNSRPDSSLYRTIFQQTNPEGVIRDTAIQKVIMNSLSDGVLRSLLIGEDTYESGFSILNNFYRAVQDVFADDWNGHTPKTSRLIHGAGIVSMGYVMETLFSMIGALEVEQFKVGLNLLAPTTAWTEGVWNFGPDDQRKWNSIQNVPRDIAQLAQYLVSTLKKRLSSEITAGSRQI